ncbi:MAG TPA: YkgJ family cysteine cluster protein [Polyangiaceae bacterium]|nr:YkgJ family cysteine cluster protein [Polyangiaceae bacterium]
MPVAPLLFGSLDYEMGFERARHTLLVGSVSAETPPNDDREARAARLATFRTELSAREKQLFEAARQATAAQLTPATPALRVREAALNAMSVSDELQRYHLEVLPAPQAIDCHAGCHWCCHMKVSLTAPEIFALVEYLESGVSEQTRDRVKARAAELSRDPRIFSSDAKVEARIPCAMLSEQGACLVYPARPLACRGYNSLDAESCRRSLDDDLEIVESNEPLVRDSAAVALGLLVGIEDAGLPGELLELTSALHIALSEANVLQRWLAGDAPFAAALAERR